MSINYVCSDVVDSGGVMQWSCSLSDCHLCRSRLSTSVCVVFIQINVFDTVLIIHMMLIHIQFLIRTLLHLFNDKIMYVISLASFFTVSHHIPLSIYLHDNFVEKYS